MEMRSELFRTLVEQDVAFYDSHKTGELVNRCACVRVCVCVRVHVHALYICPVLCVGDVCVLV